MTRMMAYGTHKQTLLRVAIGQLQVERLMINVEAFLPLAVAAAMMAKALAPVAPHQYY